MTRTLFQRSEQDELGFLRIRTKKYEIMITPNDKYLLVVLQVCTVSASRCFLAE